MNKFLTKTSITLRVNFDETSAQGKPIQTLTGFILQNINNNSKTKLDEMLPRACRIPCVAGAFLAGTFPALSILAFLRGIN